MKARNMERQIAIKEAIFAERLLSWFSENKVSFPWRETADPYKIFVSEFLLRKTTRQQVSQICERFFSKYPDIEALSEATVKSIESTIVSLGMEHIRADALKKIAKIVSEKYGGRIPDEKRSLMKLPHVGPYIANAVLCFAYGVDAPLLDTNVIRIISRVFSIKSARKRARDDPKMWLAVHTLMPKGKSRDFNLALLDFATSMCVPKNPKCSICPISDICDYYKPSRL